MKLLFIHTYYQIRGGEDAVFEQESNLLADSTEVQKLLFFNKGGWQGALQFFMSLWNFKAYRQVKECIKTFRPDVIHIHNLHFGAGPSIIHAAKKQGIPVIITLHNFRLICPSATLLYDEKIYENSVKSGFPWDAVFKGVYRNSILQTFWLAFIIWFHKKIGTWNIVDRFIVLTEFAKNLFVHSSLGVIAEKFVVKPNFLEPPANPMVPRLDHFLFIGRLSEEKGIKILLETFKSNIHSLFIAGTGPLENVVVSAAKSHDNIHYLGTLKKNGVLSQMASCKALIFPSIWYEGMPMTLIEAFSLSTPIIASNLGAMASMIKHEYNGLHFEPGNPQSLKSTIDMWSNSEGRYKKQVQENAKKTYEQQYTPERNLELLLAIYNTVTDVTH